MSGPRWNGRPGEISPARGALLLPPVDTSLFERPLDHLAAENVRLLKVCAQLETITFNAGRLASYSAPVLAPYLRWDYPRHLDWLEAHFFPQLEAACFVGDSVQEPLAQLVLEQAQDRRRATRLSAVLTDYCQSPTETLEQQLVLRSETFAEMQKRHVAWLEMSLFSLAQERLTDSYLRELARGLEEHYRR